MYQVQEYVVANYIHAPSMPEDKEVILVASDFGALPRYIVVQVIHVMA